MKKRISAELISIAHRILKLKNHSETLQLQQEAKNLYDQLTILRFYEENFEGVKNEIPAAVFEEKLEGNTLEVVAAPVHFETESTEEISADLHAVEAEVPPAAEKIIVAELFLEEEDEEAALNEVRSEVPESEVEPEDLSEPLPVSASGVLGTQAKQITFEELLAHDYSEMDFVKVEAVPLDFEKGTERMFEPVLSESQEGEAPNSSADVSSKNKKKEVKPTSEKGDHESKSSSLNDRLNKTITFGLNDRIGFEKKLFGGSSDDFNRVISQLNSFENFEEARGFVNDFVKPDYNNWEGNEEFEVRFMEIIEKKFH